MLRIENLSCHYGVIQALHEVSIHIEKKGIYAIIGANGAGKSSLINVLSGLVPASSGRVMFDGVEITDLQPHEIIKTGISVCPEGRKIFKSVSVYENLLAGAYIMKDKAEIQKNVEMVYEFFPRLSERRKQLAGTLSGGTADAGHREGAHVQPEAPSPGRALHGAGSQPDRLRV